MFARHELRGLCTGAGVGGGGGGGDGVENGGVGGGGGGNARCVVGEARTDNANGFAHRVAESRKTLTSSKRPPWCICSPRCATHAHTDSAHAYAHTVTETHAHRIGTHNFAHTSIRATL